MKDFVILGIAVMIALSTLGQPPHALHFQGIARNAQGGPLANTAIAIRISIKDAVDGGTTLYSERKSVGTNTLGLYTISINDGNGVRTGDFDGINWQSGHKFLQTEIDPANGTAFVEMGTTQIQSVPYALQASRAMNLNGVVNTQEGDVMQFHNGQWMRKPERQVYNVFGVGLSPAPELKFISQTVTVTLAASNPIIALDLVKALGSTVAGGGNGLFINLGYQKNGGPITEFDVNHRITGMRVASGTRIPFASSGIYHTSFSAGDTYTFGMVGISSNQNSWNDNGLSRGKIEISY